MHGSVAIMSVALKDDVKFLLYMLWSIKKLLRGGSVSISYKEASEVFLIKLLRKKKSLWFIVWCKPTLPAVLVFTYSTW